MAAPMIALAYRGFNQFYRVLPQTLNISNTGNTNFPSASSIIPSRGFSSKRSKKKSRRGLIPVKDPRSNVRYPYFPGDPLQEMQIKQLKQATSSSNQFRHQNDGMKGYFQDLAPPQKKRASVDSMNRFTTTSGLTYTKLKDGDIRFGRTILSVKSKVHEPSSNSILLEGQRLVRDSLLLGAELKFLYFSDESLLQTLPTHLLKDVDLFKCLYRDLKTWMDTSTPSGIMGIFKKPNQGEITCAAREAVLPITLILDGVKDPGNAGTLIRTAAAVGCEKILSLKGCVNVWEGKVLRSGMGAHFAIPIYMNLDWRQVSSYVHEKSQVLLAEPKPGESPLPRDYSSLQDELEAQEEQEMNESESESSELSDDEAFASNANRRGRKFEDHLYHQVPFPSSLYYDLDLQLGPPDTSVRTSSIPSICVVLGGETTGLSAAAKKFAYNHYGQCIWLPMTKHIDSLNTAVAGSVILYDLHRKLMSGRSF